MSHNLGDGYDHRLDASGYLRGGRGADGKAYWICVECGKHHDYSVMVCDCYQPSDYDRAVEKAIHDSLTRLTSPVSGQLLVDGAIQSKHLKLVPAIKSVVRYCYHCMREHDPKQRTCAGCGSTRFITKEAL